MKNKLWNLLDMAAKLAISKEDQRNFIVGCVAIRDDGVLVGAINGPTQFPERTAHAEYRASKKMDYNSTVYVARVRRCDGALALARPCDDCQKVLIHRKIKRVYYTVSNDQYGIWEPGKIDVIGSI